MKICLIGKYPPIEGGVSMHNYWAAYGLAERGHEIYVVTNADEVEDAFRIHLKAEDKDWYQPTFESSGGFVKVYNLEHFSHARMSHIPVSNPFVSKLASRATQIIRQYGCEAVFAYYYEPYGVAGYLASRWTGTPLAVKHAGSDLERLMRVPDLATTYKEILKSADCIITRRKFLDRFLGMGVEAEKIYPDAPFGLPTKFFNPQAAPLDVASSLRSIESKAQASVEGQRRHLDLKKPTVGIYGKVGVYKGSYDLVSALSTLKREGLDFNFLAMTDGYQKKRFISAIKEDGLEDSTWLLPFLPHWKVPRFIRACTAVSFLERDFPIAIHGPVIPREILACGTCLVVSEEIARKQLYRDDLVHGRNTLIVPDPKNHEDLVRKLRFVVQNPEQARSIGVQGHLISEKLEHFSSFVDGFEALLHRLTGKPSTLEPFEQPDHSGLGVTSSAQSEPGVQAPLDKTLEQIMPWTRLLLSDQFENLTRRFRRQRSGGRSNKFEVALAFCNFLESEFKSKTASFEFVRIESILRYQRARLLTAFDYNDRLPPFSAVDVLEGSEISEETVRDLKPLKSHHSRIETFTHDVTPFFGDLSQVGKAPLDSSRENLLLALKDETTLVCFHKNPNLVRYETKINGAMRDLLELCDGTHTTDSVTHTLAAAYGVEAEIDRNALLANITSTLKRLYRMGIVIFAR